MKRTSEIILNSHATSQYATKKMRELFPEAAHFSVHKVMPTDVIDLPKGARLQCWSVVDLGDSREEAVLMYRTILQHRIYVYFQQDVWANTEQIYSMIEEEATLGPSEDHDEIRDSIMTYVTDFMVDMIQRTYYAAVFQTAEYKEKIRQQKAARAAKGLPNGREKGTTNISQDEINMRPILLSMSYSFGGSMRDTELMALCGVSRRTFYKYKKKVESYWTDMSADDKEYYFQRTYTEQQIARAMGQRLPLKAKREKAARYKI